MAMAIVAASEDFRRSVPTMCFGLENMVTQTGKHHFIHVTNVCRRRGKNHLRTSSIVFGGMKRHRRRLRRRPAGGRHVATTVLVRAISALSSLSRSLGHRVFSQNIYCAKMKRSLFDHLLPSSSISSSIIGTAHTIHSFLSRPIPCKRSNHFPSSKVRKNNTKNYTNYSICYMPCFCADPKSSPNAVQPKLYLCEMLSAHPPLRLRYGPLRTSHQIRGHPVDLPEERSSESLLSQAELE